ncbi:MAG: TonB-dependent receptor, partial [Hyphomicrobiales bacterium]
MSHVNARGRGYMKHFTLMATSAVAIAVAMPAYAQGVADSGTGMDDGEIVVTAQKREQRLSDVGITLTAVGDQQLMAAGVADIVNLPKVAPGLNTATSYTGFPIFSVRGVNFNSPQLATPPAVSFYVDESPLPFAPQAANMLFDLQRVEVLKGPQGTLFGQNSTGGSINIIAAKPTAQLSAGFNAEVNHFGQVMVGGYVSGPLSETLRARLSGVTTQFGAWQRGYFLNNQKNGDSDKLAGRLLLDWTPTDRLTVGINITGGYDHSEIAQPQLALLAPAVPSNVVPGLVGYPLPTSGRDADFNLGFNTRQKNRQYSGTVRIDYELSDTVKLTSLSTYISTKISTPMDFDGVAIDSVYGLSGGTIKTFSQELRLSGTFAEDRGNFVFGANYIKSKIFDYGLIVESAYSGLPYGATLESSYDLTDRKGEASA